jgi:hypothetical protein
MMRPMVSGILAALSLALATSVAGMACDSAPLDDGDVSRLSQAVVPSPTVAWWKLDGNYTDSSGSGRTLVQQNGAIVASSGGVLGGALGLDGTDDHATFSGVSLAANSAFTLTTWFKLLGAEQSGGLISLRTSDGLLAVGLSIGWDGIDSVPGKVRAVLRGSGAGATLLRVTGANSVADGKWHHAAMVRNTSGDLKLYVDGVLDGSVAGDTTSRSAITPSVGYQSLGVDKRAVQVANCNGSNANCYLAGGLDDVRIYSTELTASQLAELGTPRRISGSVGTAAAGATVSATGGASASTTADASGAYSLTGLAAATYTVMPSKAGCSFSPASRSVAVTTADVTGKDFTPTCSAYSVSGSTGLVGTKVRATGSTTVDAYADASGAYTIPGLPNGTYTLTPSRTGCTFALPTLSVTVSGSNLTGKNFTPTCTYDTPIYRQRKPNSEPTDHVGPTTEKTRDDNVAAGWFNDKIVGYLAAKQIGTTTPMWHLTNNSTGKHVYTTSQAEKDAMVANGHTLVEVAGYVCPTSGCQSGATAGLYRIRRPGNGFVLVANATEMADWLTVGFVPDPGAGTGGLMGYVKAGATGTSVKPSAAYLISGSLGSAGAGATVTAGSGSATADAYGSYEVFGLAAGTYTVTPTKAGCSFAPSGWSQPVTVNTTYGSATGKNFTASCGQANGTTCTLASQCASGNCVDGYCCGTACGGACDVCNKAGSLGTCSPAAAGTAGSPSCGAYTCQGASTCPTSCTSSSQCASGYSCVGNACTALQANGTTCTAGSQCASGSCVDGYCCDTACGGACDVCNKAGALGVCSPAVAGTAGSPSCGAYTCQGAATCPTSCTSTSQCASGFTCQGGACVGASQCTAGLCCDNGNFKPAGTVCRGPAGTCDVPEYCTGASGDCPPDAKAPAGTVCRPPSGLCVAEATCNGTATCPANPYQPGVQCRAAGGDSTCAPATLCVSGNADCPAAVLPGAETACNDGDAATTNDRCNGAGLCAGVPLNGDQRVGVYELWNATNHDYFYTSVASERDAALGAGYVSNGIKFYVERSAVAGTAEFQRFWSQYAPAASRSEHVYTASQAEAASLVSQGYVKEGSAGSEGYLYTSQVTGSLPLYRLHKTFDIFGGDAAHFMTTSTTVKNDMVNNQGWTADSFALGYVWAQDDPPAGTKSVVYLPGRLMSQWPLWFFHGSDYRDVPVSYEGSASLQYTREYVKTAIGTNCRLPNQCVVVCYSTGCARGLLAFNDLEAEGTPANGVLWTEALASAAGGSELAELTTNGTVRLLCKVFAADCPAVESIDNDIKPGVMRGTTWGFIQDKAPTGMYHLAGKNNICVTMKGMGDSPFSIVMNFVSLSPAGPLAWLIGGPGSIAVNMVTTIFMASKGIKICMNRFFPGGFGDGAVPVHSAAGYAQIDAYSSHNTGAPKYLNRRYEQLRDLPGFGAEPDGALFPADHRSIFGPGYVLGSLRTAVGPIPEVSCPDHPRGSVSFPEGSIVYQDADGTPMREETPMNLLKICGNNVWNGTGAPYSTCLGPGQVQCCNDFSYLAAQGLPPPGCTCGEALCAQPGGEVVSWFTGPTCDGTEYAQDVFIGGGPWSADTPLEEFLAVSFIGYNATWDGQGMVGMGTGAHVVAQSGRTRDGICHRVGWGLDLTCSPGIVVPDRRVYRANINTAGYLPDPNGAVGGCLDQTRWAAGSIGMWGAVACTDRDPGDASGSLGCFPPAP